MRKNVIRKPNSDQTVRPTSYCQKFHIECVTRQRCYYRQRFINIFRYNTNDVFYALYHSEQTSVLFYVTAHRTESWLFTPEILTCKKPNHAKKVFNSQKCSERNFALGILKSRNIFYLKEFPFWKREAYTDKCGGENLLIAANQPPVKAIYLPQPCITYCMLGTTKKTKTFSQ